jgi:rhodanese-related sulfurtransferase/rubrerythrin
MKLACAADEVTSVTPDEVRSVLDRDETGEYLLLDVRQPEEYEASHIPGAMLIPLGELEARQGELDRGRKIITYCRSGHRSMAAAVVLCGLGFKNLYSLDGGILNWSHGIIGGIPEEVPGLVAETAAVADIVVLAIKLEKGSRDFYLAATESASLPRTKEMYRMLAEAEEEHVRRLYSRAISLLGEGALPPLEQFVRELKVERMEGGVEVSPAVAGVKKEVSGEMEALELALEREYMSYDFYRRASALVEKEDVKGLLHELAWEERKHADVLLRQMAEVVRQ